MKKKKVLFCACALELGGVGVSLINYLKEISKYSNYDITLLLVRDGGIYCNDLPKNITKKFMKYESEKYNGGMSIKQAYKKLDFFDFIFFIFLKFKKKLFNKLGKSAKIEEYLASKIIKDETEYDLVIDFHGYGYILSRYVAKYIKANKKVMFIHDEKIDWFETIKESMNAFDMYACVSNYVKEKFDKTYPDYKNRSNVVYNIIDVDKIKILSQEKSDFNKSDNINLLTIGRLEYQKGYDLLIEIAKKLKKDTIKFTWYIIGEGSQREKIENEIVEKQLTNYVKLLGTKKNPYPDIKNCDIYIQTSRHEGFGLAVTEAKILNKPVIATNLGPIAEQIEDGKNGFLCEFNATEFTDKIKYLIQNENANKEIVKELKKFEYNNKNELDKLLNLIK